jgi:hypothetical protein
VEKEREISFSSHFFLLEKKEEKQFLGSERAKRGL